MRAENRKKWPFCFLGRCGIIILLAGFPDFAVAQGSGKSQPGAAHLSAPQKIAPGFTIKALDYEGQSVVVADPATGKQTKVLMHEKAGAWALMAVVEEGSGRMAVFEELDGWKGSIVFMGPDGVALSLPKSLEPTSVPAETLYRGRSLDEIVRSQKDILASEILAEQGDPSFEKAAACLPPLRVPTFVGTNRSVEKVVFEYGGASINYIDAGKLFPEIVEARKRADVWEGLVGGWFHAPRFLFPAGEKRYWEEIVFADEDPAKFWTQPVWYRLLLVDDGTVKETHYFYNHLPYPPRGEPKAGEFYSALLRARSELQKSLAPSMSIDVPEETIADFCRHSLVLEIITRTGDHPRYGYAPIHQQSMFKGFIGSGFSHVDSFQDTFTSSVTTFLDWGLFDAARRFIDNYFTEFVREDGSIDTRGPEIGQYGRMLTALARYSDYTKDDGPVLKHRRKILAIVGLLAGLREESLKLPPEDPAHGIIRGWSEHDSCLQTDPYRFVLPHFSNSAEVARGFQDLGRVLAGIGRKTADDSLENTGNDLIRQSLEIRKDLDVAIERSIDRKQTPPYVPAVAGDKPTVWKNRVYAEMLASGVLGKETVRAIARYQSENGERLLGLLRSGNALNGFVVYGYAYGLLQHDMVREFLLFYYAHMAHLYSRGTWTAVEVASVDGTPLSTFCTPAQLTIPAMTKWMLVFEDPNEPVLWLAKGTPRAWLEDGRKIAVKGAPTKYGKIDYELRSEIRKGRVRGTLDLPPEGLGAALKIRLRVPDAKRMRKVLVNGKAWKAYDREQETVTLPPAFKGPVSIEVAY
jgi:hypothetical protein